MSSSDAWSAAGSLLSLVDIFAKDLWWVGGEWVVEGFGVLQTWIKRSRCVKLSARISYAHDNGDSGAHQDVCSSTGKSTVYIG